VATPLFNGLFGMMFFFVDANTESKAELMPYNLAVVCQRIEIVRGSVPRGWGGRQGKYYGEVRPGPGISLN